MSKRARGPAFAKPPASARVQALSQALALVRAGRATEADAICRTLIVANASDAEALGLSGAIAVETGNLKRALDCLTRSVAIKPDPSVGSNLGFVLHRLRRTGEAAAVLRRALSQRPDHPQALVNLGNVLLDQGDNAGAADSFSRVLKLAPNMAEAHSNLAVAYMRLGVPAEGLASARRAIELKPGLVEAHLTLGRLCDAVGQLEPAIEAFRRAIALAPAHAPAHAALASTLTGYGRLPEAAEALRRALEMQPTNAEWLRRLSNIVRHTPDSPDIARLEEQHQRPDLRDDDRMHVAFALAKAKDDVAEHARAFELYVEGNRLKRARFPYSREESERIFADVKQTFTPELFERLGGHGCEDETPIFVLGMPRSGTTLVEQILASHPEVTGAGEFTLLNNLVGTLHQGEGPLRFAKALTAIDPGRLQELGVSYATRLRGYSTDARFITDKLPGNFLLIGMIKLILPRAKVIHCRRNALDTCISLFRSHFAGDTLRYAYQLDELGHYYRLYADIMEHWQRVLPGFAYDIDYEKLIADQEGESRRLLAHCGLDWRAECLDFSTTQRPVHTASAVQVRQPIYTTSIGQAERYGAQLRPLLEALGERA